MKLLKRCSNLVLDIFTKRNWLEDAVDLDVRGIKDHIVGLLNSTDGALDNEQL